MKKMWNKFMKWFVSFFKRKEIVKQQQLEDVKTYQQASLALLNNLCCHIYTDNIRFKSKSLENRK